MTPQACGRTVLVIEDDGDIRDTIGELLQERNYRPLLAPNGAAGLVELRAIDPKAGRVTHAAGRSAGTLMARSTRR